MFLGLIEQGLYQPLSAPRALFGGINSDGAYFREMLAIEVKRAAADDASVSHQNHKIADIFANLGKGPRQEGAVSGINGDKIVNSLGIRQLGFTRAHGRPRAWSQSSVWRRQSPAARGSALCLPEHHEWPARTEVSGNRRNPC